MSVSCKVGCKAVRFWSAGQMGSGQSIIIERLCGVYPRHSSRECPHNKSHSSHAAARRRDDAVGTMLTLRRCPGSGKGLEASVGMKLSGRVPSRAIAA